MIRTLETSRENFSLFFTNIKRTRYIERKFLFIKKFYMIIEYWTENHGDVKIILEIKNPKAAEAFKCEFFDVLGPGMR